MKFTEEQLQRAVIELLGRQGYPHVPGATLIRDPTDILIREDMQAFALNDC